MAKEEWGTKRTCPKCGERFYDLGNDNPVNCIECGHTWVPEPILKTKQPIIAEIDTKKEGEDGDSEDDELDLDDDIAEDEDDVLGDVSLDDDDDDEVTSMVDTSMDEEES